MGRWVGCPAAMLMAAFTSAWQAKPQAVHRNRAWLSRDFNQRNRTQPALGTRTWPTWRDTRRTSHWPAAPHDAEFLVPPGLAPRRPPGRVARVDERRHRPGEVAQRLLLDGLGAGRQPRVRGPRLGELPALLQVARRALPARAPVGVLLDGQVPQVPGVAAVVPQHRFLGGRGEQPVPGHANTLSGTADISGGVTRRFLPGLRAGVSTPRF